jgi:hypothetical protein
MGLKKKVNSMMPIKFDLVFNDDPVDENGLIYYLDVYDCGVDATTCPKITVERVSDGGTTSLPEAPEASVGPASADECARYDPVEGHWVYNLKLAPPEYGAGMYEVSVEIGSGPDECSFTPDNYIFQVKD